MMKDTILLPKRLDSSISIDKTIKNVIYYLILGIEDLPQIKKKKKIEQKIQDTLRTKLE